jgi:hypothetical protein
MSLQRIIIIIIIIIVVVIIVIIIVAFITNIRLLLFLLEARGSVIGWGTMLQAGKSRVPFPMGSLNLPVDIILPAALWPWYRLSL